MAQARTTPGPDGDLSTFAEDAFTDGGVAHRIFRKGTGPCVVVITEMPGISPLVLGFADRVVALGCSVVLPDMFGTAGRDLRVGSKAQAGMYSARTMIGACISKEFSTFAVGKSSPIVDWLRALAAHEHTSCGGPGVGVVGMCFTGGFALAMAVDDRVIAPVLSQPSLPLQIGKSRRYAIDCSDEALTTVAGRCANEGLTVLGLRFHGDPFVPAERFQFLRDKLGDGFEAVELHQADGNPDAMLKKHHSVLTGDLIDEPGEPTRDALDKVLNLFRTKLLPSS